MTEVAQNMVAEGICPTCHQSMQQQSPRDYYCQVCAQHYYENYICPICNKTLEQIKGCGAINYLCQTDGLISGSKVIYQYLAQ
ncbi:zinc ribbon protein [Orbus hercynius]|uniref:Zinc ribbon protein n=1 Tax=Orbus hercynius TaxID=593135 RepID=A0A495REL3_9GAMM|nr:zinc-ribbon domain-containing protein [Orbus hercynius]RKS85801.1 zinc ribbon protein [Orbus hercynius]